MKTFFLLIAVVITIGCNSKAEPIGVGETPATCSKWDQDDCFCPNNKTLIVDGDDKHCVDIKSRNICLKKKNGFQWALHHEDPSIFNSCLYVHGKSQSSLGFQKSRLYIWIDKLPMSEKLKFARWADGHKSIMESLDPWATPSAGNYGDAWFVSSQLSEERAMSVIDPVMLPLTVDASVDYYTAPKIFPNVEELTLFLENSKIKNSINVQAFPQNEVLRHLLNAYQSEWTDKVNSQKSLTEAGCQGSCWKKFSLSQQGEYSAELWSFYLGGSLVRSEIVLMSLEKEVVGTVYLADQRFLIATVIQRGADGVYKKIDMYNILGENVYSMENTEQSQQDYRVEQKEIFRDHNEFNYLMVVCEDGFTPKMMKDIGLTNVLAFGPFTDTSFYGWFPDNNQKYDYWNGRVYLNDLLLPVDIAGHPEHAALVSAAAIEGTLKNELGIIPMSIKTCSESKEMNKVWPVLKEKTNVRVVNFSSALSMSEGECERTMQDHPLTQDEDVLWVAAGGNYGVSQSAWCPQYLSGKSNLILAAGTDGESLASYSNTGEDFMDIGAPGRIKKGSLSNAGTSFAAPRVSQVAAKIFYFYPSLKAHDVKMAILLGAEEPWTALPVRSRGLLNEKRAMGYASLFHKGYSPEKAIREMECSFSYYCPTEKEKLNVLKKMN